MEMPFALDSLLPLACAWAEDQERDALASGRALTDAEIAMARQIGVRQPERVRVLEVAQMPTLQDPTLRLAAAEAGLSMEHSGGMALRYGIFLLADQEKKQATLAHELTHTAQYERYGGFDGFFRQYFTECLTVGYWQSPLELEAVDSARDHVY